MKIKLQAFKQRQGHDIGGVRPVMIPDDAGEWVSRHDAEHQIEQLEAQRDALLSALTDALVNNLISSIKGGAK